MADVPDQPVLRGIEHIVKSNRQLDPPQPGAEMAGGDRPRVHGLLAQFVGELAELTALQPAHVSRRLDEVKERGLGGLGHVGRLRRRMGGDNLTGWLKFNQTGPQAQTRNAAKSLMHLAFSTGSAELALLRGVWSISWGERVASWHQVRIGTGTASCRPMSSVASTPCAAACQPSAAIRRPNRQGARRRSGWLQGLRRSSVLRRNAGVRGERRTSKRTAGSARSPRPPNRTDADAEPMASTSASK